MHYHDIGNVHRVISKLLIYMIYMTMTFNSIVNFKKYLSTIILLNKYYSSCVI